MDILAAPLRPEDAELVTEDRIGQLIDVAKSAYDIVVLDTPPHFDATTLAALDRSDRLVLVTTMDIPTVKNAKLALQTLNLLQYPRERIALVVNRPARPRRPARERHLAHARHADHVRRSRATRRSAPPSTAASRSPSSSSRSPAAKAIRELAELLLPAADRSASSKPARGEAPGTSTPSRQAVPPAARAS